jgi:hypothetical protein
LFVCLFFLFLSFFPCSINLTKFAADAICSSKQGRNDSEHVLLCRVCIRFSFGFSVAEIPCRWNESSRNDFIIRLFSVGPAVNQIRLSTTLQFHSIVSLLP